MQKFDFNYRAHELDDLRTRSIYEDDYDIAVTSFITWIHQHGFIGYFDNKTVIGNPNNRQEVAYTDGLCKASLNVYVLEYTFLEYHSGHEPVEEKKRQLFMSDAIQDFILAIKSLQNRGNVKNLRTYKGSLTAFDFKDL